MRPRPRHAPVAALLAAFALSGGVLPLYLSRMGVAKVRGWVVEGRSGGREARLDPPPPSFLLCPPQPDPDNPLPRQASARGPYINIGSRDAGPDPDWVPPVGGR
jgi:hypothetical protein